MKIASIAVITPFLLSSINAEEDVRGLRHPQRVLDDLGCLLDEPPNLLASVASDFFGRSWRALLSTQCDQVEIEHVFDEFFSPNIVFSVFGQTIFDNLAALNAAQVPGVAQLCSSGVIVSWVATKAEAVDCNTMKVFMNELLFDGASGTPIVGDSPGGREYTFTVDAYETIMVQANTVCPFDMSVAECGPATCTDCFPGTSGSCRQANSVCWDLVDGSCPVGSFLC